MGMDHKKLLEKAAVLKNIPRTGWLQRGVPPSDAETIAEHTFEVTAILTIIGLAVQGLNKDRLLLMGAVHDGRVGFRDIPRSLTSRIGRDMHRAERRSR
jgi:putative hydrolase of HD superfamily